MTTTREPSHTGKRKLEHLQINLHEDVGAKGITTGFERFRFVHQALPELDLTQVDTATTFLGLRLRVPLLISSMTGGTERASLINANLAATTGDGLILGNLVFNVSHLLDPGGTLNLLGILGQLAL